MLSMQIALPLDFTVDYNSAFVTAALTVTTQIQPCDTGGVESHWKHGGIFTSTMTVFEDSRWHKGGVSPN